MEYQTGNDRRGAFQGPGMVARIAVAATLLCSLAMSARADTIVPPDYSTGALSLSGPGAGEANLFQGPLQPGSSFRGDLVLSPGTPYTLTAWGIDLSGTTREGTGQHFVRIGIQDSGNDFLFETFFNQALLSNNLLQSGDAQPFTVQSSHGFGTDPFALPFDLRLLFEQAAAGGTWTVAPQYRLNGEASFSTFFDGPWISTVAGGFDFTNGKLFIDGGGFSGTLTLTDYTLTAPAAVPEPSSFALGAAGLALLAWRRSRHTRRSRSARQ